VAERKKEAKPEKDAETLAKLLKPAKPEKKAQSETR